MRAVAVLKQLWTAGVVMVALAVHADDGRAQLAANAEWRTIESAHFRVTFEPHLAALARHTAASAERARTALRSFVAEPPDHVIDIVLADNLDQSNGYATPFPSNRIVVYAKPPVDVLELQHTRDWIELVVTHELAHIYHLDVTSGFGSLVRGVFGRVPLPWPVFPAVGTPLWSIEGLAVGAESHATGFGRIHGSYNEMVVRTAALAGRLDEYDRLGSGSARWPGGARVYIYGSMFLDYVTRRHGADATARIVRSTADAVIPPLLWFGRTGSNALGVSFREAYGDWEREVEWRSDSLAAVLRADGLTEGEALTRHAAVALHPRFSPDGRLIAYAAYDWRTPPQIRVIDARTGTEAWSERMNQTAPAAWMGDRLFTSDIDFTDRFHAFADLHEVGAGRRRLTRGERLQDVDVSGGGRIVAVQNNAGTNRIVLVHDDGAAPGRSMTLGGSDASADDAGDQRIIAVTPFDPDVHWALPRFSPSGDRIAAARWTTGGAMDIVVLDTLGTVIVTIEGFGIDAAPAWSPDGRWVLFSSDRTGVPNIYAADVARLTRDAAAGVPARPALRQVTNVLTGAFHPDVSRDGRWIAYAMYTNDGFRIERMPFDTAGWRVPQPAGLLLRIVPRPCMSCESAGGVAGGSAHMPLAASERTGGASGSSRTEADTVAGESRTYNAFRSLRPYFWSPMIDAGAVESATFIGAYSYGQDLVGRHAWNASLAAETDAWRTQARFGYSFRGLPDVPGFAHPVLSGAIERSWETVLPPQDEGDLYIDEREDAVSLSIDFVRGTWRRVSSVGVSGERIRRSRDLYDAPQDIELVDARDDLWGVRLSAYTGTYVTPPLSISRESGYTLQAAARQRREVSITTRDTPDGRITYDAAYRELTTWNTAYVSLPFTGFARHVLALRMSALLRDGPGAGLTRVGGAAGSPFRIPGIDQDIGGSSSLLPVRGFRRGHTIGSNAWTASIEYRAPLAFMDTPSNPLFFDRLSLALFADAGHAWCDDDVRLRFPACTSTSSTDASLLSAGAEVTARFTLLGIPAPVRAGLAMPLRGTDSRSPRFYVLTGPGF